MKTNFSFDDARSVAAESFRHIYQRVFGHHPVFSWETHDPNQYGYPVQSLSDVIMGRMLSIIEMLGLEETQREAAKSQVRQIITDEFMSSADNCREIVDNSMLSDDKFEQHMYDEYIRDKLTD